MPPARRTLQLGPAARYSRGCVDVPVWPDASRLAPAAVLWNGTELFDGPRLPGGKGSDTS